MCVCVGVMGYLLMLENSYREGVMGYLLMLENSYIERVSWVTY